MKKLFAIIIIIIGLIVNQDFANALMPAELVSFEGKCTKEKIYLEWSTASELNLNNFEIYRAQFNDTSPLEFVKIDEMKAKGTSSTLTKYGPIIDSNVSSNLYYCYKLKLIDKDGASSNSNEIVLFVEKDTSLSINEFDTEISFDVFNNSSLIRISSSIPIDFDLNLFTYDGRFVEKIKNYSNFVGVDEISLLTCLKQNGVYFIELRSKNKRIIRKLVVN